MSKSIMLDPGIYRFVPAGSGVMEDSPVEEPALPDIDAIKKQAFESGCASARQELAVLRDMQNKLWQNLNDEFEEYLDSLERHLNGQTIELAVQIAETIVQHSLPDADMLKDTLKGLLGKIVDSEDVKVRVNPEDLELLQPRITEGDLGVVPGRVEFVGDPSLSRGDMLIENGFGCYDARISQRMSVLKNELKERLQKSNAYESKE